MTHAQRAREAAVYRREFKSAMPLRTFNEAGVLVLAWPHRTYTITPTGRLA